MSCSGLILTGPLKKPFKGVDASQIRGATSVKRAIVVIFVLTMYDERLMT